MKKTEQDKFTKQIQSVLDQSVLDIDAETKHQLQMARVRALQSNSSEGRWYQRKSGWMGVAGFASMSMLAAFLFLSAPEYPLDDLDIVSNGDGLLFEADAGIELYEQYEFYVWLSRQEANS